MRISYLSKNMKWKVVNFLFSCKGNMKCFLGNLFHIQFVKIYFKNIFVEMRIETWLIFHPQKLGSEFHIYQKTWNGNLVNPTNFSIFKEGNHLTLIRRKKGNPPQHSDSHPLHPTTFLGDTMNSKPRRLSELGGNEWAWIIYKHQ